MYTRDERGAGSDSYDEEYDEEDDEEMDSREEEEEEEGMDAPGDEDKGMDASCEEMVWDEDASSSSSSALKNDLTTVQKSQSGWMTSAASV